jgi:hypothetical protein
MRIRDTKIGFYDIVKSTTLESNMSVSAYRCLNAMIEALENILSTGGSKYQITFA